MERSNKTKNPASTWIGQTFKKSLTEYSNDWSDVSELNLVEDESNHTVSEPKEEIYVTLFSKAHDQFRMPKVKNWKNGKMETV